MQKIVTCIFVSMWLFSSNGFAKEAKQPTSQTLILQTASHQFDVWGEKGITLSMLKQAFDDLPIAMRKHLNLGRIQIVDNEVYFGCPHGTIPCTDKKFMVVIDAIRRVLARHNIPNIDFLLYVSDGRHTSPDPQQESFYKQVPSFLLSKNNASDIEKDFLVFPDSYMLEPKWPLLVKEIEEASIHFPWEEKKEQIFWRGGTSGGVYSLDNIDKLPRLFLGFYSKMYPEKVNINYSHFVQFAKDQNGKLLEQALDILFGKKRQFVPEKDQVAYKYLASVDGNTAAWMRVPWILLSNSVLVKQESGMFEWFYPGLKPYQHYVPLKEDLSDIIQQYDWMKAHDAKVKRIARNGTNFIKENLMPEHIEDHIAFILKEYAKIQKFTLEKPSLPNQ